MARSAAGESVLSRAVRVLETFEQHNRLMTVAEIARRAKMPVPTAHRLVNQLTDAGFLERDAENRVRIGMRLWEVAARAPRPLDLREAALPFLEDVHFATRQHTHLDVLDGTDVLVVERLKAPGALSGVALITGHRIPAHAGSTGLVLLAHAPSELRDEVMNSALCWYNERTPVQPDRLRRLWASAREQGYLVCDGFIDSAAMSIAVPVAGPNGAVVAALGIVIPSQGARPMTHVPVLLAAAKGISRVLSAPGEPRKTRVPKFMPAEANGSQ
jgi:DNA-binding IclR family transcriptional regulator